MKLVSKNEKYYFAKFSNNDCLTCNNFFIMDFQLDHNWEDDPYKRISLNAMCLKDKCEYECRYEVDNNE